jgi:competence ComEA-like helix-hairpin-helix protein
MRMPALLIIMIALLLASCGKNDDRDSSAPITPKKTEAADAACVDLNSATAEELMRLPGVGQAIAGKIIEYRERNGPLRRPEELIIIDGFGERKYRQIAHLVCVKGSATKDDPR